MDLFKVAKESDTYQVPNHYAIVEVPKDANQRPAKEAQLLELKIQPIWFPSGEFDKVERLVDLIADVAEKRFVFTG